MSIRQQQAEIHPAAKANKIAIPTKTVATSPLQKEKQIHEQANIDMRPAAVAMPAFEEDVEAKDITTKPTPTKIDSPSVPNVAPKPQAQVMPLPAADSKRIPGINVPVALPLESNKNQPADTGKHHKQHGKASKAKTLAEPLPLK